MAITAVDKRIFDNNFNIMREVKKEYDQQILLQKDEQQQRNIQQAIRNDQTNTIVRNEEFRKAENFQLVRRAENDLAVRRLEERTRIDNIERFRRQDALTQEIQTRINIEDTLELSDRRELSDRIAESILAGF